MYKGIYIQNHAIMIHQYRSKWKKILIYWLCKIFSQGNYLVSLLKMNFRSNSTSKNKLA